MVSSGVEGTVSANRSLNKVTELAELGLVAILVVVNVVVAVESAAVEIVGAVEPRVVGVREGSSSDARTLSVGRHMVDDRVCRSIVSPRGAGMGENGLAPTITLIPAAWHRLIMLLNWVRSPRFEIILYDTGWYAVYHALPWICSWGGLTLGE